MITVIKRFSVEDSAQLRAAIDTLCGEGRWMSTSCFQPTGEWSHALTYSVCERHLLLVVEINHVVAGWCRLFPESLCAAEPLNYNLGIGIVADCRDRGLGTSLIGAALLWAKSKGARQVELETRSDNRRAIHVFEKSGFQACRQLANNLLQMKYAL